MIDSQKTSGGIQSPATVVVVEDSVAVADSLDALLGAAGYQCRVYQRCEDLLADGLPEPPCCVISDQQLPGMSGSQLVKQLATTAGHIPVMLLTGSDRAISESRISTGQEFVFMHKPVDSDALLNHTKNAVQASCMRALVH